MLNKLAHLFLQTLNPERAHMLAKRVMRDGWFSSGPCIVKESNLFGQPINNRLGLAAGFDKNGELVDVIEEYGFGFIEVGSITHRGGPGNLKPRLFRLDNDQLLNRMGLNGDAAELVVSRLRNSRSTSFAINIAKTHSQEILGDVAIDDICATYKLALGLGLYVVINISCPNTKEGKTFEEPEPLAELLSEINKIGRVKPVLVKISPTLSDDMRKLVKLTRICEEAHIDGYIASNTVPFEHPKYGKGGLSGGPVRVRSLELIRALRSVVYKPIIGVGGIYDSEDMLAYMEAGACACQAYCGFVRGPNSGPRFAYKVLGGD